jgi:TonB family protein
LFPVVLALSLLRLAAIESPVSLVPENGPGYSFRDGVLELRAGGGWLRTSRLYLNFRLSFEFRAQTPEVDAGVLIRTWTGVGGWPGTGYRLRLPIDAAMNPAGLLVGHRLAVDFVEQGRVALKATGEWQQVEISGEGPRITFAMNGSVVGVYDVDSYGGHIFFDNKRGLVQLRNISIDSTERSPDIPADVMTEQELKAAGGRAPKLIRELRPSYTSEAMRRIVQGHVDLEAVVLPDGSPGPVRVKRSLDPDLDLSAIAAVRAWKFQPAVLGGKPVSVLVDIEMTFRLK